MPRIIKISKRINTEKLYKTARKSELYDAERHLKNSYLSNLLKTPDAIDKYKEQLEYLEKYDDNCPNNSKLGNAFTTLRYIFNEFGYIDAYTMRVCIADVNRYKNTRNTHKTSKKRKN